MTNVSYIFNCLLRNVSIIKLPSFVEEKKMSDPKITLDKIQREIKENLEREDELKKGHLKLENGNDNNNESSLNGTYTETTTNGYSATTNGSVEKFNGSIKYTNGVQENGSVKSNGVFSKSNDLPTINGFRKFVPHNSSRGVMQKFIKNRGRLSMPVIKKTNEINDDWYTDAVFDPPKVNPENGKPTRKGFIPAEEKIERELTDFQQREAELRKIRRQSQPDLMAALEQEEQEESEWRNGFKELKTSKHTKSMANLYQVEDEVRSQDSSAPSSLKPARSLAELCDISDEESGSSKLNHLFHNIQIPKEYYQNFTLETVMRSVQKIMSVVMKRKNIFYVIQLFSRS